MSTQLVVVMDDIAAINVKKDTTFAMLLEAQRRGYPIGYVRQHGLFLAGGECHACMHAMKVTDDPRAWFELGTETERSLGPDDLVLMRVDPPVDDAYLYTTYLLELAEAAGARVFNRPRALRDFNEKMAIARFPELIPDTLVSADPVRLKGFVQSHGRAVLKPLDGMGGRGVFLAAAEDPNLNVILETLTSCERLAMAQEYLPAVSEGDKRIVLVAGKPVEYMLARVPVSGDFRGNLARGGRGEGRPLGAAERRIAEAVGPLLMENGIVFAGLDVIGEKLTEINVTSPTCVRELDAQFGINIAGELFDDLKN